jgi:hypothetical protein
MTRKTIEQCANCPWKVGADLRQIPSYDPKLHDGLRGTIAEDESFTPTRGMACHHAELGKEKELPCAGWLHHQIGPGNSIPARLNVMNGRLPVPVVHGDQYETFEETLGRVESQEGTCPSRSRRKSAL